MGAVAVIAPRSNRKETRDFDKHYYTNLNSVEKFFCRFRHLEALLGVTVNEDYTYGKQSSLLLQLY